MGLLGGSWLLAAAAGLPGCGGRTPLETGSPPPDAGDPRDGGPDDAGPLDGGQVGDAGRDAGPDDAGTIDAGCVPVEDGCGDAELCGNGIDDDCDGRVDEDCPCTPGAVQSCFRGPPGRRGLGACQDGEQVCLAAGTWGACEGGIVPDPTACTGRDDLCTGCPDERVCEIDCPNAGDPRIPDAQPFDTIALDGRDFFAGEARGWRWTVEGGICDVLSRNQDSFVLEGADRARATLTPRLSGDLRVRLEVDTPDGEETCTWIQPVAGPGVRIEACWRWPEFGVLDLDLFVSEPGFSGPWYPPGGTAFDITRGACGWHNCEPSIRGTFPDGTPYPRADWGYPESDLSQCEGGPLGDEWRDVGFCPNPRLDVDSNSAPGRRDLPENINIDNPDDGDTYRVMLQNFTGTRAEPVVNVYCGGRRVATFGQSPDTVPGFSGPSGFSNIGAMWRVADVTAQVDPTTGDTTGCAIEQLHPPGETTGFDVTVNAGRF